ncbi:hypothetical protein Anapl_02036 [Anas platyrhynchos]|uniref:Uncharacterized protein n=1 Tax=Anas platyrhynchos TaxID=8839 RepID=R0LP39_ANAPL|nr:hypothetical protein Anapl_02036 [Anas platyrhynchos]
MNTKGRLVPISNTTTEHMAKKLQQAIIKIAGLNKYEQFIMVKVLRFEQELLLQQASALPDFCNFPSRKQPGSALLKVPPVLDLGTVGALCRAERLQPTPAAGLLRQQLAVRFVAQRAAQREASESTARGSRGSAEGQKDTAQIRGIGCLRSDPPHPRPSRAIQA